MKGVECSSFLRGLIYVSYVITISSVSCLGLVRVRNFEIHCSTCSYHPSRMSNRCRNQRKRWIPRIVGPILIQAKPTDCLHDSREPENERPRQQMEAKNISISVRLDQWLGNGSRIASSDHRVLAHRFIYQPNSLHIRTLPRLSLLLGA